MGTIRKTVEVSELLHGDTIEVYGELETVDRKYLKYCSFMGHTYKSDPHRNGIVRITFVVPTNNGYRYG